MADLIIKTTFREGQPEALPFDDIACEPDGYVSVPIELAERLADWALDAANQFAENRQWADSEKQARAALADSKELQRLIDAELAKGKTA